MDKIVGEWKEEEERKKINYERKRRDTAATVVAVVVAAQYRRDASLRIKRDRNERTTKEWRRRTKGREIDE